MSLGYNSVLPWRAKRKQGDGSGAEVQDPILGERAGFREVAQSSQEPFCYFSLCLA